MSNSDLSGVSWRKSNRSNGNANECVEVAVVDTATAIRDSKNRTGGILLIDTNAWDCLRAVTKASTLDLA